MQDATVFIINPNAGRGRTKKNIPELLEELKQLDIEIKTYITKNQFDAVNLAKEAADNCARTVVAVGGDGTLHEVINGVIQSENSSNIKVGLIPLGGGNDFAHHFKFSFDLKKNLNLILQNQSKWIDIGKVEDLYFINSLGIGFDALVSVEADKIKFLNGLPRYLLAVFRALKNLRPYSLKIKIRNFETSKEVLMLSIGNASRVGGGFKITPGASVYDGKLDIAIVDYLPKMKIISFIPKAVKGTHINLKEISIFKELEIDVSSNFDFPIYVDGELPIFKDKQKLSIKVIPKAINFIHP